MSFFAYFDLLPDWIFFLRAKHLLMLSPCSIRNSLTLENVANVINQQYTRTAAYNHCWPVAASSPLYPISNFTNCYLRKPLANSSTFKQVWEDSSLKKWNRTFLVCDPNSFGSELYIVLFSAPTWGSQPPLCLIVPNWLRFNNDKRSKMWARIHVIESKSLS